MKPSQTTSLFLNLLIFSCCVNGFGQADSLSIPFVAYWDVGDTYEYKITKIKKSFNKDKLVKTDSTTYFGAFSVIDSTTTEYLINWKYKMNFTNLPLEFSELLNDNSIVLDFKYKTDELGSFIELENWQEIADIIRNQTETEINKLPELQSNALKSIKTKAIESVYENILTKEGIEQLVLSELQLFHFPFGVEFNPSEPIVYEDEYANFIGDSPLKGQVEIKFTEVDYDNYFCVFTQEGEIYPEDTKRMLIDIFNKLFPDNMPELVGKKIEDEIKSWKYDITDNNIYAYFYYPGVPYYIETNRTVNIDTGDIQNKATETLRIELILEDE